MEREMKLMTMEEKKDAPTVFEEVRSVVYIVGQLDESSKYSAAIFKVELGRNGEVVVGDGTQAKDRIAGVFDQKKYFEYFEPSSSPCLSSVACDRVDELLCLVCSYSRLGCHGDTFQAPVQVFNTVTEELTELRPETPTLAPKPFPSVMAVGDNLYVFGQCMSSSVKVPKPTLELFDLKTHEWESSSSSVQLPTPQFELPRSMDVEGYAVLNNYLVISVVNANGGYARDEFLYWKFSDSSHKWEKLIVSEDTRQYPFSGKAEFVHDVIYSYSRYGLVAYRVQEEGVLAISPPLVIGFPEFAAPPVEWYDKDSFCFAYMGIGKKFCIIETGDELYMPDEQYVAISVVEVSNDLSGLATLASSVFPLKSQHQGTQQ